METFLVNCSKKAVFVSSAGKTKDSGFPDATSNLFIGHLPKSHAISGDYYVQLLTQLLKLSTPNVRVN